MLLMPILGEDGCRYTPITPRYYPKSAKSDSELRAYSSESDRFAENLFLSPQYFSFDL